MNDLKHGIGYFEWENGNSYAGAYVKDEREGYGVMRYASDGSSYLGMWQGGF